VRSYRQELNLDVWSHCYLEDAYLPDPFFHDEFAAAADAVLGLLNMNCADITISNAKAVYLHLCRPSAVLSWIFMYIMYNNILNC